MLDLFGGRVPSPRELLAADPEAIRAAGLSRPKITYLRDLADRVEHGELALERLGDLPDDEVREQLVAVRGLGRWTADMFLIFHLRRPDVLPVGDLGIRRAVERIYVLEEIPDAATLGGIAHPEMDAMLGMPVVSRGDVVGAFYLTNKEGGFEAEDQRMMELLAAHAAIAIGCWHPGASGGAAEETGVVVEQLPNCDAIVTRRHHRSSAGPHPLAASTTTAFPRPATAAQKEER